MEDVFPDRRQAGRELAQRLMHHAGHDNTVVLALPRGGVPVGYEVAEALHLPLEVFVVRKLGVPGHEELAMGAIASGGVRVLNPQVVNQFRRPDEIIAEVAAREMRELERREFLYRGRRPAVDVRGKTVIVVDDGLATGSTMHAAVRALRQAQVGRIIVAVPVAPPETCSEFTKEADELVCLHEPRDFMAVGQYYEDFSQTTDEEVSNLLAASAQHLSHT
ncbi:MAG: phosphoribosyltransferase [Verrucomicrobiaceae bacterium]|nr:MAG: phosphoribosyltransferase [Verrucomicrobiaceae bacterium]